MTVDLKDELDLLPVLLAGGTGSRLWPLSRGLMPKQFICLSGQETMLQKTFRRLEGLASLPPVVICNEEHRFIVAEQARQLDLNLSSVILEPVGRNTAPAIALVALQEARDGRDPLMLVMPSDHLIGDVEAFQKAVNAATGAARNGKLVTFGIVPDRPETGYGYIHAKAAPLKGYESVFEVACFVEKPDLQTAQGFLEAGNYFWNSGIFLMRASQYLSELTRFRPDVIEACKNALEDVQADMNFARIPEAAFSESPDVSVDYAVMEQTELAAMVPLDANWSDLGAWSALWDVEAKDAAHNVLLGDVVALDTSDSYIRAEGRLVATVGVDNVVVVETKDAVLVASRERVQDVKALVAMMKDGKRTEHHSHLRVFRPWGDYESIDDGHRFQVKRITVRPGEKLSLQMHYHRAEHWIVVKGTALVECDGKETLLTENQSTFIPIGSAHRLSNPGKVPLELIEVQSGAYLGEDDIVRFNDSYGRK